MRAPSSSTISPCCSKVGIKRGPWTPEEDKILSNYIKRDGEGRWRTLPKRAGLQRCGKSCRLRWMNYLRPSVKRGQIAPDEEDLILRLHRLLGNRWALIAGRIPGRTDNEIKNYWNTHLSKKLINQGIDPRTHKPLNPSPFADVAAESSNKYNNLIGRSSFAPNPSISTLAQAHHNNAETLDQTQPMNIFSHRYGTVASEPILPLVNPQLDTTVLCNENWQHFDGLIMMGDEHNNNNIVNAHQSYVLDDHHHHNCNNDQYADLSSFWDTLIGDAYVSTPHPRPSTTHLPSTPIYGQGAMWGAELRSAMETMDDNHHHQFNNNIHHNNVYK